ncbi:hypothetical protein CASFOL_027143 [Castilleja foliolosa]|uniref:Uncharacterized protein n=1 Tax=Castilleja foliolosa TaxID=1961234 RepID=A0ABD3CHN5_9LAMI
MAVPHRPMASIAAIILRRRSRHPQIDPGDPHIRRFPQFSHGRGRVPPTRPLLCHCN